MSDRDSNNNNLSALLAGVLIGAAGVYLFGTEKGRKIKDELLVEGQKLLEKIGDQVDNVQDQIELHHEEIKDKLTEGVQKVEATAENLVENITEIPEHIAQVQKKGRRFFFNKKSPPAES